MKGRKNFNQNKGDQNSAPQPFTAYPRCAGILLHITSLPSRFGVGDLGPEAFAIADFLRRSHQTIWQVLPVNSASSTGDFSPYGSDGSFAGNIWLISPEQLQEENLLSEADLNEHEVTGNHSTDYEKAVVVKQALLSKAYQAFKKGDSEQADFTTFCKEENQWLDDYALYIALKKENENKSWSEWDAPYKLRQEEALQDFASNHAEEIEEIKWQQYIFRKQWRRLKAYCNEQGIKIFGDLPFYVAYDSADVWAHRSIFKLDKEGQMQVESGAPLDEFNTEGQRWGMPVYNWAAVKKENYNWWLRRMKNNIALFDLLRLDHFRGFSAYWEIPVEAASAKEGKWQPSPGIAFFKTLKEEIGNLPLVAEDLGTIDEPVIQLREQLGIPGMIILQLGFGEDMPQSEFIPHHHYKNAVLYTGNHDNNTTIGWFESLSDQLKENLSLYAHQKVTKANVCEVMSRLVYASVAKLAILPAQDLLQLDAKARMNGVPDGERSWSWRLPKHSLSKEIEKELQTLCFIYDRENKMTQ